jgi:Xaa-Pro aminopeptidase
VDYKGRLERTRSELARHRVDAFLVTHLPNIRYLCGFSGSAGVLLVAERQNFFFSDGRYRQQAHEEVEGAHIKIQTGKSALVVATESLARLARIRRIGIEPLHLTVADRDTVANSAPRRAKLIEVPPIVEGMRMLKDGEEVSKIRAACHLGVELFGKLLNVLRPGIQESEIAGEVEFAARKRGVDQMAFSTIVAGGPRSALPHGRASAAPIPSQAFVVCDFGVILAGYCSDMTRTVHVGPVPAAGRHVYQAVQEAQQAAIEAVKPGTAIGEVDRVARKSLRNNNLHKLFPHSTGHGLGLEVHEAPRVAAAQSERLMPGMVITIEPGVYVPGKFGVRIEDTVVVTETGCEILTPCSKALLAV